MNTDNPTNPHILPQPLAFYLGCFVQGSACFASLALSKPNYSQGYAEMLAWYVYLQDLGGASYDVLLEMHGDKAFTAKTSAAGFSHFLLHSVMYSMPEEQVLQLADYMLGEKMTYLYCQLQRIADVSKRRLLQQAAAKVWPLMHDLRQLAKQAVLQRKPEYQVNRWDMLYDVVQQETHMAPTLKVRTAKRHAKQLLLQDLPAQQRIAEFQARQPQSAAPSALNWLNIATQTRLRTLAGLPVRVLRRLGVDGIRQCAQGVGLSSGDRVLRLLQLGASMLYACSHYGSDIRFNRMIHAVLRQISHYENDQPLDEHVLQTQVLRAQMTEIQVGRDTVDHVMRRFEQQVYSLDFSALHACKGASAAKSRDFACADSESRSGSSSGTMQGSGGSAYSEGDPESDGIMLYCKGGDA